MVLGLALGKVDQDVGDSFVLPFEINAGHDVGPVLLSRQRCGLAVGAALREGVDGGAGHRCVGIGVGVERNEEVGIVAPGDAHALAQRDVDVGVAGEMDGVAATGEGFGEPAGFVQNHFLLPASIHAGGNRVDAAMAGVENDDLACG